MGRPATQGESPVSETDNRRLDPEYRRTRETLWEAGGDHPPSLNTT